MNVAGEIVVDIGLGGKCDLDCNGNFLNANAKSFSKLPPTMDRATTQSWQSLISRWLVHAVLRFQ